MPHAHRLALNTDLSASAGAPERVELIPAGPTVAGRDGRQWLFDTTAGQDVMYAFALRGADLPIDWEHASQHRAPRGEEAPAAAWITGLSIENGALIGTVRWNERAANQVAAREYRYLSPVFDYEPDTGRIVRLVSAGLTNLPNLHLQALNQEHSMSRSTALVAAITGALGLAADASDDAIATAINQLRADGDAATARALNAEQAQPALERYVPRADYDAVLARAANAEQQVAQIQAEALKAEAEADITAALEAGRIAPASVEHYRALCSEANGLATFRALVKTLPVIGKDTDLGTRKPPNTDTALNAEERAICQATGVAEADFLAARNGATP